MMQTYTRGSLSIKIEVSTSPWQPLRSLLISGAPIGGNLKSMVDGWHYMGGVASNCVQA